MNKVVANSKLKFINAKNYAKSKTREMFLAGAIMSYLTVNANAAGNLAQAQSGILSGLKSLRIFLIAISVGIAAVSFVFNGIKYMSGDERGAGAEGKAGMIKTLKALAFILGAVIVITIVVEFMKGIDSSSNIDNSWK